LSAKKQISEKILDVKDLSTYFYTEEGVIKAVDGLSFSLKKGETLGIAGESGSGKTVASLSILRLIPWPPGKTVSGQAFFEGKDLLKTSNREIRDVRGNRISMIFQDPMTSLNPAYSVGNQIMETIILHQRLSKSKAYEKAIELLCDVGIPNAERRINQFPHEFSGGMRQRVMIAMALACNPTILIADEPTTALDVTIQAQILRLMNKIKEESGSSIMIITHDLGVIAEMADSVLVMYAGKVMEYSDVETIFYDPQHPYTMGLLESLPHIDEEKEELFTIKGNPPNMSGKMEGCYFNPRCIYAKDICFKVIPELGKVGKNHYKACHLQKDEINNINKVKVKNG
jgi:oligopeptide/dipeptide ABC transporter ATP-binding protein